MKNATEQTTNPDRELLGRSGLLKIMVVSRVKCSNKPAMYAKTILYIFMKFTFSPVRTGGSELCHIMWLTIIG